MESYDSWEDEPVELVEIHVRLQVDLANSMTHQIVSDEGDDGDWTRIDGEWQEGFIIPDGVHHKRCSTALNRWPSSQHNAPVASGRVG